MPTDATKSGDPDVMTVESSAVIPAINLPNFWPDNVEVWFALAEAAFETAPKPITSSTTKFYHVLRSLDSNIATEVSDIILRPDPTDPYTKLKEALIARTSASMTKRLKQLLSGEQLGDRKPSQLLRKMRQLVDKNQVADSTLREIFLQRLPMHVQAILAAQETLSLEQTAEIADKILENAPQMSAISASAKKPDSPKGREDKLEAILEKLTGVLERLEARDQRSRSPGRDVRTSGTSRRRSSSRRRRDGDDICFYHRRFGDRATKCTSPCKYVVLSSGNEKRD